MGRGGRETDEVTLPSAPAEMVGLARVVRVVDRTYPRVVHAMPSPADAVFLGLASSAELSAYVLPFLDGSQLRPPRRWTREALIVPLDRGDGPCAGLIRGGRCLTCDTKSCPHEMLWWLIEQDRGALARLQRSGQVRRSKGTGVSLTVGAGASPRSVMALLRLDGLRSAVAFSPQGEDGFQAVVEHDSCGRCGQECGLVTLATMVLSGKTRLSVICTRDPLEPPDAVLATLAATSLYVHPGGDLVTEWSPWGQRDGWTFRIRSGGVEVHSFDLGRALEERCPLCSMVTPRPCLHDRIARVCEDGFGED